jgi:hypothetical protein
VIGNPDGIFFDRPIVKLEMIVVVVGVAVVLVHDILAQPMVGEGVAGLFFLRHGTFTTRSEMHAQQRRTPYGMVGSAGSK